MAAALPPRLAASGLRFGPLGPVDIALNREEIVTLAGPSGSGKTLLLRALADLDPHQGEVRLDGVPSSKFVPAEWRRKVGLLPAESGWWSDRVGDHMSAPQSEVLSALGFGADVLTWSVSRLSSGERQRLALSRLLSNRPLVLLLDEPTANLDGDSAARVESLILRYRSASGAAVLWVSHDPAQAHRVGNRALELRHGTLVLVARWS
jgi:UDP-glucose/iron transport system ATP-binding protein